MQIGIGLDGTLGLSYEEQAQISAEAAKLGYTSVWTPEGAGEDAFISCYNRWLATKSVVDGGLTTGIAVSPAGLRSPMGFALSAGTMGSITGGRFILGIGSGGAANRPYRRTWNIRGGSALHLMRDYLTIIRGLLAGEAVDYTGKAASIHGGRLGIRPAPRTPVYLAALGPEMLKLGGELADGIALNWCSAEQVGVSRKLVDEGSARAGRPAGEVKLSEYIRVCVDDDVDAARRAYTRALMGYALGPLDAPAGGYRAHFERMGFRDDLARIDDLRRRRAPDEEIIDAFPESLLRSVGYYGPAAGAGPAFRSLAEGLDTAVVRVVPVRRDIEATRAVMLACKP